MKRLIIILILLGPLTAMAQYSPLLLSPQSPKVKEINEISNNRQTNYHFDSTGRFCAESYGADHRDYTVRVTGDPFIHRKGMNAEERLDSLFLNDDSLGTIVLRGIFHTNEHNDTTQLDWFSAQEDDDYYERASCCYLYDVNHKLIRSETKYGNDSLTVVTRLRSTTYDTAGRVSLQIETTPVAVTTTHIQYDTYGNTTLYHETIVANTPECEQIMSYTRRLKYKYDKYGNWTSCKVSHNRKHIHTITRKLTYWQ